VPIVLIEPENMKSRHDELANEMILRGYNHKSNYIQPDLNYLSHKERYAKANLEYNKEDLFNRCKECGKNIYNEL
jgi:hypothetical protein